MEQLLPVADAAKEGIAKESSTDGSKPALDLLVRVPSGIAPAGKTQEQIESGLVRLLVTLARLDKKKPLVDLSIFKATFEPTANSKDDKIRIAIDERLENLQKQNPQDLSIAIALAAFRGQMKDERFGESVTTLASIVSAQRLEEIVEGRRPNSRQRKAAANHVPLWIVAREAMKIESLRSQGTVLANRSLEGAKRQTDLVQSATILLDWSSLLLEAGDKAGAEEKLTELLRISTQRPTRKKKETENGVGAIRKNIPAIAAGRGLFTAFLQSPGVQRSAPEPKPAPQAAPGADVVPPLTISQFRWRCLLLRPLQGMAWRSCPATL